MNDRIKSWLSEHQTTLIVFLFGQLMVFGAGAASAFAYMVKLEGRVSTMEERGAVYTVSRLDAMKLDIAKLQQDIDKNEASINRIVDVLTKKLSINP